jgi:hypothetical protein
VDVDSSERRNKAVLNGSPDLPLLFLLLQLLIAVLLLHVAAVFITRVEIPKLEFGTAKKLTPVVLVNIIGLIFNTLCLRDVEASFFQVCGLLLEMPRSSFNFTDCAWSCSTSDHHCILRAHSYCAFCPSCNCCWDSCNRFLARRGAVCNSTRPCCAFRSFPILWHPVVAFHRFPCCPDQVLPPLLQQLNYSTCILDQLGLGNFPFPFRLASQRNFHP